MNTLSWLLYFADVAGGIDSVFTAIAVVSLIAAFIWGVIGFAAVSVDDPNLDFWRSRCKIGWSIIAPSLFFGSILSSAVPSKDTIYAIAASEMGEQALQTPTADRAFKAINSWLDKQIEGDAKKDDTK